jgi:hypothetical protein
VEGRNEKPSKGNKKCPGQGMRNVEGRNKKYKSKERNTPQGK